MHTVVLTPTFLRDCKTAGVSEPELQDIVATVAAYIVGRQILFPLRSIPRATAHGRTISFVVAGFVFLASLAGLFLIG